MSKKTLSLFKSNRGVAIVFFSPIPSLLVLGFFIIVFLNKVIGLNPKGVWNFYFNTYFMTLGPIVLGYVVTPILWKDIQKKALKVIVISVRVFVPILIYILLRGTIINYILDLPSAISGKPETIAGIVKVDPPREADLKYDLHTTRFLIGYMHLSIDNKDYTIVDSEKYKVLFLKHSNGIYDIVKVDGNS